MIVIVFVILGKGSSIYQEIVKEKDYRSSIYQEIVIVAMLFLVKKNKLKLSNNKCVTRCMSLIKVVSGD